MFNRELLLLKSEDSIHMKLNVGLKKGNIGSLGYSIWGWDVEEQVGSINRFPIWKEGSTTIRKLTGLFFTDLLGANGQTEVRRNPANDKGKPFDIIINGKSLTITDAVDIYYWHTSGDYFSLRNKENTTINVKFKPAPTDYE